MTSRSTQPKSRPNRRSPRRWSAPRAPTAQQLEIGRKLGAEVANELVAGLRGMGCRGGEMPGMIVPLAVVAATTKPIGLVVGRRREGNRRSDRLGHHPRRR